METVVFQSCVIDLGRWGKIDDQRRGPRECSREKKLRDTERSER